MTPGKIGFHFGSQSTATGYGDYIRALDAAGIPAVLMSTGGEGFGDIEACWDNGSTVPHVAVIRSLTHNDVPRYDLPIDAAVTDWLDRYCPTIGGDVVKYHQRVITKHGNELDRNRIQWLADFYIALHPALLARMGWQSHRICIFNFAGGNPDPDQWELILPQLEVFANNPDKFVIGCHEYSFNDADIWAKDGGGNLLIGRFKYLFDTCDAHNIKRPLYAIHEWGWRDIAIPPTAQAMADIDAVNALYCQYPQILGAGIWTLQEWQGSGINLKVQQLITPVMDLTLNKEYDGGEPMPDESTEKQIFDLSQEWAFPVNEQAALQKAALADGFTPSGGEAWHEVDGIKYAMQPFYQIGQTNNKRTYYAVVGEWSNVMWTDGTSIDPTPSNPLTDLKLGYLFEYQYSDSYSPFNAPRDYGNGKHEGLDADVIGGQVDNKVNVLCTYDGVVDRSLDSTGGYGKYVRVAHERNGSTFYTRYCHLDERFVDVGDYVQAGDAVGEVGSTGNVDGEHVHFNLEAPGYGLSGYVVADVVDPYPYLPSDNMSLPPLNNPPPPSGKTIDMLQYFTPATGSYGPITIKDTNWGQGQVRQQIQAHGDYLYVTKGNEFEARQLLNNRIFFIMDDSPGDGKYYTVESADGWIPRYFTEGQEFTRKETARFHYKNNCNPTGEVNNWTNVIKFVKFYQTWTAPGGLVFSDVSHLQWILNGVIEEDYYLAPHCGYALWKNKHGRQSHIVDMPQGQSNNVFNGACYWPAFGKEWS